MKRIVMASLLPLSLCSCEPVGEISIAVLNDWSVEFAADPDETGNKPKCIGSLAISEVTASGEISSNSVWEVFAKGQCLGKIQYPNIPEGYEHIKDGVLKRGHRYRVVVETGEGFAYKSFRYSR